MDTKWNKRTASRGLARRSIKFICLALSIVLVASAAAAAMTLVPWGMNLSEKEDYVTAYFGESTERYFNYQFQWMFYSVQTLMEYTDRDSIANGDYLRWDTNTDEAPTVSDLNAGMVLSYHLLSLLGDAEYAVIEFTPDMNAEQLERSMERAVLGAVARQMLDQTDFYDGLSEENRQRFLQGEYMEWVPEWHWTPDIGANTTEILDNRDDNGALSIFTPPPTLAESAPKELYYRLYSELNGEYYAEYHYPRGTSSEEWRKSLDRLMLDCIPAQRDQNYDFYDSLTPAEQQKFVQGAYFHWRPEWRESDTASEPFMYSYTLRGVDRHGADDGAQYATVNSEKPLTDDSPLLRNEMLSAIRHQLEGYDDAAARLSEQASLRQMWWYASETLPDGTVQEYGERGLPNSLDDGYLSTYARWEKGSLSGSKVMGKNLYWQYPAPTIRPSPYSDESVVSVYIGYDPYFVTTVYDARKAVQDHIAGAILWVILLLLPALALFCVAAVGVGRRVTIDGSVELIKPRKLWLEVLLAIIAVPFWLIVMDIGSYRSMIYYAVQYYVDAGQESMLYLLTALLAGLLALPVALWLLAVIHRVKAGRFWRHTFIWAILALLWRILRALWRGMRRLFGALPLVLQGAAVMLVLTVEVLVIASTADHSPEFCLLFALMCFVFDSVFIGMILTQLRTVERSAAAAARGEEARVPPMFGVFGRIGRSVGNLSGSVALAVEDRMKSERLKTELITNVSHDIRTPLTGLIAYVDLLQTEGLDSDNAPEYVNILAQKAQRLKSLTDDLFEASKAASGNVKAELETLDLSALARQVLGEMDERIAQSGLDFRVTLPEHAPAKGDGRMMWRVMENLIDNALKYSLPSSRVYLSLETGGGEVRLWLKNVSALPLSEHLSELTDRFKRGDASRSTEGSGLGLSIVQSFMDNQGGRLLLSADGDLFKACVTLPVG